MVSTGWEREALISRREGRSLLPVVSALGESGPAHVLFTRHSAPYSLPVQHTSHRHREALRAGSVLTQFFCVKAAPPASTRIGDRSGGEPSTRLSPSFSDLGKDPADLSTNFTSIYRPKRNKVLCSA